MTNILKFISSKTKILMNIKILFVKRTFLRTCKYNKILFFL